MMPNIPARRRRVHVPSEGVVTLVTEDTPVPEPHEALVATIVSGVCGSDTHALHGQHPAIALPYYPGHEVVGVVVAVGADVTSVAVGDRVTPEPTLPCGTCKVCLAGHHNVCENLRFFGCGYREGGMADNFTCDASRLHKVPAEFTDHQAALIEPLSTPVHATGLAGDLSGKTVAILGSGTIGLLMLSAARAAGARKIVVTDVLADKRALAERAGADATVDAADPDVAAQVREALGESADAVFDCVAIQPTVDAAVAMVAYGGVVVIVGVPAKPVTVNIPHLQDRQIALQGAATYLAEDYRRAMEIIGSGAVDAEAMVTKEFPVEQVSEAFAASESGHEVKVLIRLQ
ncbi:alcohol dehydrogenase catalytic domain-containing protein [Demequina sp.]|uniref:zinc-dependent alcohol dehydrogenase n=1 Tax=Demequina sp. TaxID=2050685 RepID=UPI0025B86228|nr:alcohol dehydrogenase catalytic domain-containing protein [Demequina sp.]